MNRVSVEYISKPPLVDEHAFPLTGFALAWLGCSLHYLQDIHQRHTKTQASVPMI